MAQGLSRSLSSFSNFMREYLDSVIKADKCAQYVDEIGKATNTPDELKRNLKDVFQCLGEAGLRLTMAKCQFGAKKVEFLRRTVSPEGISPQTVKVEKFLEKLRLLHSADSFSSNQILFFLFLSEIQSKLTIMSEQRTITNCTNKKEQNQSRKKRSHQKKC